MTLGDRLRRSRENLGYTYEDIHRQTHLPIRYLQALEEENFQVFPAEVYLHGTLRSLGKFLRIPENELLELYRQLRPPGAAEPAVKMGPTSPAAEPMADVGVRVFTSRNRSRRGVWLFLLFVCAAGLLGWAWRFQKGRLRFGPPPPAAPAAVHRLEARTTDDVWILLSADGQTLFEGILPKGSQREWTAPGRFRIKAGNVRGIRLFLDGQPVELPTLDGRVSRDTFLPSE